MGNEWLEMLASSGIKIQIGGVSSDENTLPDTTPQLVDLSDIVIIEVTGEGAQTFLQGQFCNDLNEVSVTKSQLAGYCTPKGRLLALPTIVEYETGYRLLLPITEKEAFIKRLRMFVMRSKVTITERTDWVCTGILADTKGNIGPVVLDELPQLPMEAVTSDERQIIRWHDDHTQSARARYIVVASVTDQIALWRDNSQLPARSQHIWRLADISAGVPRIAEGAVEAFVPQMINLQLIDGLSFTKGCYPGQEIVARMQYLGKLKRHMRVFFLAQSEKDDATVPQPGDTLSAGTDTAAGIVVDSIRQHDQGLWVLAVVKVSANEADFQLQSHALQARSLPYELPSLAVAKPDAE